jgi:hypothetical protein
MVYLHNGKNLANLVNFREEKIYFVIEKPTNLVQIRHMTLTININHSEELFHNDFILSSIKLECFRLQH